MTINSVLENIELTEKVFRELIVTSNYSKTSEQTIGWKNYTSGIFKNFYAKEYEVLIRKRQYSFLLTEDKGCIQIYFSFMDSVIHKVKMAYYPYPVKLNDTVVDFENYIYDSDDELIGEYYYDLWNILNHQFELSLKDEELTKLINISKLLGNDETPENLILKKFESKYGVTNCSHLRIDYDPNVTSHHKCEIQIGAINNIRLPMRKLVMPFLFVDFIVKNVFPDKYTEIIKKRNFNTDFNVSRNRSFVITPFTESNINIIHD